MPTDTPTYALAARAARDLAAAHQRAEVLRATLADSPFRDEGNLPATADYARDAADVAERAALALRSLAARLDAPAPLPDWIEEERRMRAQLTASAVMAEHRGE